MWPYVEEYGTPLCNLIDILIGEDNLIKNASEFDPVYPIHFTQAISSQMHERGKMSQLRWQKWIFFSHRHHIIENTHQYFLNHISFPLSCQKLIYSVIQLSIFLFETPPWIWPTTLLLYTCCANKYEEDVLFRCKTCPPLYYISSNSAKLGFYFLPKPIEGCCCYCCLSKSCIESCGQ